MGECVSPPDAVLCHAELGPWDCSWTGKPSAVDTHWQPWPQGCGGGGGGGGRVVVGGLWQTGLSSKGLWF